MNRIARLSSLFALALAFAPAADAAFTGTQGFADLGSPSVNTPGLGAATVFTLSNLETNANHTGGFTGVAAGVSFGGGSFTTTGTSTLTLGNANVGNFVETVAPVLLATATVNGVVVGEVFNILGTFTPSAALGDAGPVAASFTVSMTQTGGPGTSISASGTLSIPPFNPVPEPASITMLGLGLVAAGGVAVRRRSAK